MIVSFLTDFKHEGELEPETRLSVIVKKYLYSIQFAYDFIALIPLAIIFKDQGKQIKLLYLLKIFRMIKGLNFFNVKSIFESIKLHKTLNIQAKIAEDPLLGEDTEQDHNHITQLMLLSFGL